MTTRPLIVWDWPRAMPLRMAAEYCGNYFHFGNCSISDTILDPFGGAGTTGLVADRLQRDAILIELNPQYAAMAAARIKRESPLIAEVAHV